MDKTANAIFCITEVFSDGLEKLMHPVEVSLIPGTSWKPIDKKVLPEVVVTICPHCNNPSHLSTEYKGETRGELGISSRMNARCPICGQSSSIWAISTKEGVRAHQIWMLPPPKGQRTAVSFPDDSIPEGILRSYRTALNCFNARIWTATINECGRIIEKLTRDKFKKEDRKELARLTAEANKSNSDKANSKAMDDVAKTLFYPVLKLSSAARLSRKAGSHAIYTEEPDAKLASDTLTLTEQALEYFYGLPSRIDLLKDAVEKIKLEEE